MTKTTRTAAALKSPRKTGVTVECSTAFKNRLRRSHSATSLTDLFYALAACLQTPQRVTITPIAWDSKTGAPTHVKRRLDKTSIPKSIALNYYSQINRQFVGKTLRPTLAKLLEANASAGTVMLSLPETDEVPEQTLLLTRDYVQTGGGHNDSPSYDYVWHVRLPSVLHLPEGA